MKIGILKSDTVRGEFQQEFGDYPSMFERIFLQQDQNLEFVHYDVENQQYPNDINEVDLYLITGSKFSVYQQEPWIKRLSKFVVQLHEQKKPLIGICFGHQLIAQALGGKTEKASQGWNVGVHQFEWLTQQDWIAGNPKHFKLVVSHQDQVSRLPKQAKIIAGSDFCPIGAYQIGSHILCFQGHPEFLLSYSAALMTLRQEILGARLVRHGQASLSWGHDGADNVQSILNFYQQAV